MEWQTLASVTRECAALPKPGFKAKYPAPFLLQLDWEQGVIATDQGETRSFEFEKLMSGSDAPLPSLTKSRILNLGGGQAFVLGRSAECEIQIPHDTVSEKHCKLESFGSIWSIQELGSRNGTFLNGRRMAQSEQSPLKFGTKIMLGEVQFQFLGPDDAFELIQELSKEPRIRPRSLGKYRAEFKEAGDAAGVREAFPGPFLVVQAPKGREAGGGAAVSSNTITLSKEELTEGVNQSVTDAIFNLSAHNLVRIGRATVTQIHLPLAAISNLHAALIRNADDSWSIQDLGAKNGTYLWGDRLEGLAKLESGTEITLGNIKSIFFNTEDLLTYALHRDTLV